MVHARPANLPEMGEHDAGVLPIVNANHRLHEADLLIQELVELLHTAIEFELVLMGPASLLRTKVEIRQKSRTVRFAR